MLIQHYALHLDQRQSSNAMNEGVIDVSLLKLVWELCQHMTEDKTSYTYTNPLRSTFQAPTNVVLWSTEYCSKLCNNLVRTFYDTILLRRWEWFGLSKRGAILSPACKCMSFSHHLMCEGRNDDADCLVEAVSSFTECRVFREREAMLTFLSLLAVVQVDNSHDNLPVVSDNILIALNTYLVVLWRLEVSLALMILHWLAEFSVTAQTVSGLCYHCLDSRPPCRKEGVVYTVCTCAQSLVK